MRHDSASLSRRGRVDTVGLAPMHRNYAYTLGGCTVCAPPQNAPADEHVPADRVLVAQVRAGTGGEEAALWAADLVRMYRVCT